MNLGRVFGVRPEDWVVVWLGALLLVGCSRPAQPDPELVAKVGSREIRIPEFQAWMQRRATGNNAKEKADLLDEILDHAALVQRAAAAGLDRDPELVRSWENLLIAKLRELQFEPRQTNAQPTEESIRSYYETHRAEFTEPALRRGAILFLEFPRKASAERRAQIRQRLADARALALAQPANDPALRGFGPLAVEYSEDQATRYRGGDIGWVQSGRGDARFDPEVLTTLFALPQSGAVSEVLETPRGSYLVKLLESRPERVKPMEAVAEAIRHRLWIDGQKRLENEWKQENRAAVSVQVFPAVLDRIPPRSNAPAPAALPHLP